MPKQISDLPADFCPVGCPCRDLSVDSVSLYAHNTEYITSTQLTCEHEKACAMWVEKQGGLLE